ncbi:MAG: 3'-5' exonuclease [Gammaproteobacteria bacterium]|nr:3'-5' exonuclease [Gammaproteobacteria bacterium]
MAAPFDDLSEVAAIDCETTGLDPAQDRIVKMAIVLADLTVDAEQETQTFEATLNPGVPIPVAASRVHGISDEDVEGLGDFGEIAQELTDFVGDRPLIGFNVRFDKLVLNAELRRHGFKTFHRKRSYCVHNALRGIWGYPPSLPNALTRMSLKSFVGAVHDPLNDALATVTLAGMLNRLSREQVASAPGDHWTANPKALDPPTQRQLDYISSLGGKPRRIRTKQQASEAIDRLKTRQQLDEEFGGRTGCATVLITCVLAVTMTALKK